MTDIMTAPMWDAVSNLCNDVRLLTITMIAIGISQIVLFALICIYISISNNINKTNIKIVELFELKLNNSNVEKVEDIDTELIQFILTVFMDYRFISRFNDDAPVSDAEETQMYQDVMDNVISKMSPALLDRILKIYNKDRIHDIIRDKTIRIVSEYCMECNRPK